MGHWFPDYKTYDDYLSATEAEHHPMKAWHFLPADRHTRWNRTEVKVGQTLTYDGPLILCESGLHASIRAIDALLYAPGPIVCRVELSGEIKHDRDKSIASRRTCLAMNDATETLFYFSRWCALSVIDKWDAPQVVLDYLMTGDRRLRAAARDAAWDAAWNAARAAAWDATRAAARDAAWDAAWNATRTAGEVAARAAERDAAWDAQNEELERLLTECLEAT